MIVTPGPEPVRNRLRDRDLVSGRLGVDAGADEHAIAPAGLAASIAGWMAMKAAGTVQSAPKGPVPAPSGVASLTTKSAA